MELIFYPAGRKTLPLLYSHDVSYPWCSFELFLTTVVSCHRTFILHRMTVRLLRFSTGGRNLMLDTCICLPHACHASHEWHEVENRAFDVKFVFQDSNRRIVQPTEDSSTTRIRQNVHFICTHLYIGLLDLLKLNIEGVKPVYIRFIVWDQPTNYCKSPSCITLIRGLKDFFFHKTLKLLQLNVFIYFFMQVRGPHEAWWIAFRLRLNMLFQIGHVILDRAGWCR